MVRQWWDRVLNDCPNAAISSSPKSVLPRYNASPSCRNALMPRRSAFLPRWSMIVTSQRVFAWPRVIYLQSTSTNILQIVFTVQIESCCISHFLLFHWFIIYCCFLFVHHFLLFYSFIISYCFIRSSLLLAGRTRQERAAQGTKAFVRSFCYD